MPRILLSYRRSISETTVRRISAQLAEAFGGPRSVIHGFGSIRYDSDFRAHIDSAIRRCDALLVIIDPAWLSLTDSQGARRIDNPQDFVRLGIESALRRGKLIVPVLIDGAAMPSQDDLPPEVRPLAFRPAANLRPDPQFNRDLERLVSEIRITLAAGGVQLTPPVIAGNPARRRIVLAAVALIVLAALFLALIDLARGPDEPPARPNPATRTAQVIAATATRVMQLQIPPTGAALGPATGPGAEDAAVAISAETVWRLEPVGLCGRGQVSGAIFSPDGTQIAVMGSVGVWLFDAADLDAPPRLLADHAAPVTAGAYSPDGTHLLTGSRDGTARVWNVATGSAEMVLRGHTGPVLSVAWSPDGLLIATGGHDGIIQLWNAGTGGPLWPLQGHEDAVLSLAFSPDSLFLASGGADETARLWDTMTGEQVEVLTGRLYTWSVDFSPAGNRLVTAGGDGRVRVWNIAAAEEVVVLPGHSDTTRSVSWSPGGSLVASGGQDHTIRLWNLRDQVQVANLRGHSGAVLGVDFSPDGARLLSASDDGTVRLWNTEDGAQMGVLRGFTNEITLLALRPAPEGAPSSDVAVMAERGGLVRLVDLVTGAEIERLPVPPAEIAAWSPDGARLALGEPGGQVRVWDVAAERTVHLLMGANTTVDALAWSPNGALIAVGGPAGLIELWNATSGERLRALDQSPGWVTALAWSPDGTRLAAGSTDHSVTVWSVGEAFAQPVADLLALPEGESSAGQPDSTPLPTAVAADSAARRLIGHAGRINALAWSPDGTRLASASADKTAVVWMNSGRTRVTLYGPADWVSDVAWTPDGSMVAGASFDGAIWLWNARTGEPLRILADHTGWVARVIISPDGRRLISASWDGTVRQWTAR